MLISIAINADTREQKDSADGLFSGTSNEDYLTDGVYNKIKFFEGFEKEVILFIDQHLEIPEKTLFTIRSMVDTLVIRRHTNENNFNDYNYISALSMARGDYIAKFDQDTAAFTSSPEPINKIIASLEDYRFISYPSYWSPRAITDESFGKRTWASTRFFMCKRETLKFDVLRNCIKEPDWAYQTFGDSPRRCNWLEHFLTLSNNDSCFYPPMDTNNYTVFSWGHYEKYTLRRLNEFSYDQIKEWLNNHSISYPNDVFC